MVDPQADASRSASAPLPSASGPTVDGGPRVALVSHAYAPSSSGGVETYVADLAKELLAEGAQVVVIHPHHAPGRPDYEVDSAVVEGVPVRRINRTTSTWYQDHGDPRFERVFRDLLVDEEVHVVHFHHVCGSLSPALVGIARGVGAATVMTLHDAYTSCARGHAVDAGGRPCAGARSVDDCATCIVRTTGEDPVLTGRRLALRNRAMADALLSTDLVTSPSRYLARLTTAAPLLRDLPVEVRPLGLALGQLLGDGSNDLRQRRAGGNLRVGVLGNLERHPSGLDTKGAQSVVAAARALPGIQFHLHGRISEEFLDQLDGLPNTVVHGTYDLRDRTEILRGLDCLLVASPVENWSTVVREAHSSGVPVVSGDGGGLGELVRHGENGLLFPACDEQQMIAALNRLANDEALRRKLASGCAAPHDIAADAAGWLATYEQLQQVTSDALTPDEEQLITTSTGAAPRISVVFASTDAPRLAEALHEDLELHGCSQVAEVLVAPGAAASHGFGPTWADAARSARGDVLVLVEQSVTLTAPAVMAHLLAHSTGPVGVVSGPVRASLEVDADPAAAAWRRVVGLDREAPGRERDLLAGRSWVGAGTSYPTAALISMLDAGAFSHPFLIRAALQEAGLEVRFDRRAGVGLAAAPAPDDVLDDLRRLGRASAEIAAVVPELSALVEVDALETRLEESAAALPMADRVIQRFARRTLSELKATSSDAGSGPQPADVVLARALDVVLEHQRLLGALSCHRAHSWNAGPTTPRTAVEVR